MTTFRSLTIGAAALTFAASAGTAASASTVFISASQLVSTSYIVTLGGTVDGNPFGPMSVFEAPELLTASIDGGPNQSLLAFCVDIFHGFGSGTPPVTYQTQSVQFNSNSPASGGGTAVSSLVSGQVGYLASLGKTTNNTARLAGIQGAIWQALYPNLTISGGSTSFRSYYTAQANAWGAANPNFSGYANGIYASNGASQGFGFTQGFTTGGVPEPMAWVMMITGFGMAGAILRRRRALARVQATS